MDARVTSVNTRSEKAAAGALKNAVDIDFEINVPASFLKRLSVGEVVDFGPMLHKEKGDLQGTSLKKMEFEREYEEYKFTISFSPLKKDKEAQTFLAERIKIKTVEPIAAGRVKVRFQVQTHPYEEKDVGWLIKNSNEIGKKECYLKFEQGQKNLADLAEEVETQGEKPGKVTDIKSKRGKQEEIEA